MAQFYSAKRRVTTRQIITVSVHDLDAFGQGVAHHNGKTLFIQGALPGEKMDVIINQDKRQYARATVKRIITTSPQRLDPLCPHYTRCGGCQQQHASIALQQQSKVAALERMLTQAAGFAMRADDVISGQPWGYRRRARLGLVYQGKTQTLQMGFRLAASDEIVNITRCPILKPELEALLVPLHAQLSDLQAVKRLGHVELVLADSGPVLVLRHLAPLCMDDRKKLEQFSHKHNLALYLAPDSDTLEQVSGVIPTCHSHGMTLTFSPRDFIQVNDEINQKMVTRALEWLDLQPEDRVLDLFCGMGNFTLPLGKKVKSAVGVEGVAALVRQAAYNAEINNLHNVAFYQHNLEEDVRQQPWAENGFNKVLLDPARAGAAGVMAHIVRLAPTHVVYISCNPTTLARDSQALLAAGYRAERITMLDMFPHTGHLESMVLFRSCGAGS